MRVLFVYMFSYVQEYIHAFSAQTYLVKVGMHVFSNAFHIHTFAPLASAHHTKSFPLGSPTAGVVGLLILLKGIMSFVSQRRLCSHILIFGTTACIKLDPVCYHLGQSWEMKSYSVWC